MASKRGGSHLKQGNVTSDDRLEVREPAAAIVLPAGVKNLEKLNFDHADVIALFKKKNYKLTCPSESCDVCWDRR